MPLSRIAGLALIALTGCASTVPVGKIAADPSLSSTPADPARAGIAARVSAAVQSHDYRQAVAIEDNYAKDHPTDWDFRHNEPVLYRLAGDSAGWEHARNDLLQTWARSRGSVPPPRDPSFTVDLIQSGQDLIVADQCYERAGRFGVIYRFTVFSPGNQVRSFFTVESPDADNRIARELGRAEPVFTLDHFRPGMHETVAMLPGLPDYANLRRRVLDYIADPQPVSASSNGQPGLSNERCGINQSIPRS